MLRFNWLNNIKIQKKTLQKLR